MGVTTELPKFHPKALEAVVRQAAQRRPLYRLALMNGFMIEDMEDLHRFRAWLGQQPVPRLVDWLVEAGFAHRPLLIALNAEWGNGADGGWNPGPLREAIRRLTEQPDMATWRESDAIGSKAAPIGCLLRHVLENRHAVDAVELAEDALQRIAELSMAVQDSEVWSMPCWMK